MKLHDPALQPIRASRELLNFLPEGLQRLLDEIASEEDTGQRFMKLFFVLQSLQMDEFSLEIQNKALQHTNVFRVLAPPDPALRVLAIMGPGNMLDNAPLDFILFDKNIQLDLLYVSTSTDFFKDIPEHDVAILALGESSKNKSLLELIQVQRKNWPRPFLNHSQGVMNCARDTLYSLFKNETTFVVPSTRKIKADQVLSEAIPCLIRPIDTHAGENFEKIDNAQALVDYLNKNNTADAFYISEFIDCSQSDGLYRKFRIALIDKKPYICHLAISEHWVVHYIAAHMELSPAKRAEEEKFMTEFNSVFLPKYGAALKVIAEKIDLDYVVLDGGISMDGKFVLFEADNGAWIHDTDPVELYPYKKPAMARAFSAFIDMLKFSAGVPILAVSTVS